MITSTDIGNGLTRDTANKLNPLIGMCCADTLGGCGNAIRELGYLLEIVANSEGSAIRHVTYFTDAIAAALAYETTAQERIDSGHA